MLTYLFISSSFLLHLNFSLNFQDVSHRLAMFHPRCHLHCFQLVPVTEDTWEMGIVSQRERFALAAICDPSRAFFSSTSAPLSSPFIMLRQLTLHENIHLRAGWCLFYFEFSEGKLISTQTLE